MHTFSRKWRRRAAAVVVGLALAMASTPGVAAAAPSDYSVLQINLCNSSKNPDCYAGGDAPDKAGELIAARQPSVVTMNEMCKSDITKIMGATGYSDFGTFTRSGNQSCERESGSDPADGSDYGNALLFPPGTEVSEQRRFTYAAQNYTADVRTAERRTLACALADGVTACVTHLHSDSKNLSMMENRTIRIQQADEMRRFLDGVARRGPTVLGGDWNLTRGGNPDAQDFVPAGMFRKGDGNRQHVLASGAHFRFDRVRVMELGWTDHPGFQVYYTRSGG